MFAPHDQFGATVVKLPLNKINPPRSTTLRKCAYVIEVSSYKFQPPPNINQNLLSVQKIHKLFPKRENSFLGLPLVTLVTNGNQ